MVAALSAHAAWYRAYVIDDAAISFSYARSLAERGEPSLLPGGERTEGFSNPAWTALAALAIRAGIFDPVWFAKLAGSFLLLASLVLVMVTVDRASGRRSLSTPVVALFAIGEPSFVVWGVSGLENALLAFLLALGLWQFRRVSVGRGSGLVLGLVLSALSLTRPEGLGYGLLALGVGMVGPLLQWIRRRAPEDRESLRQWVIATAVLLFVCILVLAWRWLVFHDVMPGPAYAKLIDRHPPESLFGGRHHGVRYVLEGLSRPIWLTAALMGMCALALRARERMVWLTLSWTVFGIAFAVIAGGDWMMGHRFLTPVYLLLVFWAASGAAALESRAGSKLRGPVSLATSAILLVALSTSVPGALDSAAAFRKRPTVDMSGAADFTRRVRSWADGLGQPFVRMGWQDLGGSSWVGGQANVAILDLAGLCDRYVGRIGRHEGMRDYVLQWRQPDILAFHGEWSKMVDLNGDPRFDRDYMPVWERRSEILDRIAWDRPELRGGVWVRRDFVTVDTSAVEVPVEDSRDHNVSLRGHDAPPVAVGHDGSVRAFLVFEVLAPEGELPLVTLEVSRGGVVVARAESKPGAEAYVLPHGRAGDLVPLVLRSEIPDGGWHDGDQARVVVHGPSGERVFHLGPVDPGAAAARSEVARARFRLSLGRGELRSCARLHETIAHLESGHPRGGCRCDLARLVLDRAARSINSGADVEAAELFAQLDRAVLDIRDPRRRELGRIAGRRLAGRAREHRDGRDPVGGAREAWPLFQWALRCQPSDSALLVEAIDVARLALLDPANPRAVAWGLRVGRDKARDPWRSMWVGAASSPWAFHAWRLRHQTRRVMEGPLPPPRPIPTIYLDGWFLDEPWGRWMHGRTSHTVLWVPPGASSLTVESSNWEAPVEPVEVRVNVAGQQVAKWEEDGLPWQWRAHSVPLPPDAGRIVEVEIAVDRRWEDVGGGRTRALPVKSVSAVD